LTSNGDSATSPSPLADELLSLHSGVSGTAQGEEIDMHDSIYRLAIGSLLLLASTACETAKPDETPRLIMDQPEEAEQKPGPSVPP
jgi:hypothetical protein